MGQQFYVIKRNPTPGSPAYFELEAKRAKKAGTTEQTDPTNNGSVAVEGSDEQNPTDLKGQRQQPKRDKGKQGKKKKKR
jgi:YidC/Oxa1 family membrane protein insertase